MLAYFVENATQSFEAEELPWSAKVPCCHIGGIEKPAKFVIGRDDTGGVLEPLRPIVAENGVVRVPPPNEKEATDLERRERRAERNWRCRKIIDAHHDANA